jgi:hypothetical protein
VATKQRVPSSAQFLIERAFSEPQCRDTRGGFEPGVVQSSRAGITLRDFGRFGAFILGNGVANKGRCCRSVGAMKSVRSASRSNALGTCTEPWAIAMAGGLIPTIRW